jgi:hypothetical protein
MVDTILSPSGHVQRRDRPGKGVMGDNRAKLTVLAEEQGGSCKMQLLLRNVQVLPGGGA